MLVPSPRGKSNLAIALQAPLMRLTADEALQWLPAMQRAAAALAAIDADVPRDREPGGSMSTDINQMKPELMLSVREVFGIDSDLQGARPSPNAKTMCPTSTRPTASTRT